jgi:hypothetical protein
MDDGARQTRGHLIVRTAPVAFAGALAAAEGEVDPVRYEEFVRRLWAALPMLSPARYRGFDRFPLEAIFESDVQTTPGVGPDWVAKVRMREDVRLGSDDPSYWELLDPDVVEDLAVARDVLARTDRPEEWEVVAVDRVAEVPGDLTLGFDVGTWGDDHFSIVRDAMLVPRRHPAAPEDFAFLVPHARRLNAHQLFATHDDAAAYRAWYRTRRWAEREDASRTEPEFQIVRVDAVPAV